MSSLLIATKLHIPATRSGIIRRERLLRTLAQGVEQKLTLIAAPAGSGKSTLLADWAERFDGHIAWLSLDEEDNDATRFLTYLVRAIQVHDPECGSSLAAALQTPSPPAATRLLPLLINDLDAFAQKLVIVLDDYQVIEQPAIHQALVNLLTYLPANVHVIVATRIDPPFPLAKLRASRALNEIRAADLRFTDAEATSLLEAMAPGKLSVEESAMIQSRTEGWAVGLQLAGLALKDQADVRAFVHHFSGSHRFVIDYLSDEVYKRQPPAIQDFLLASSLLKKFNADLCNVVMARDDSAAMIDTLEATNLFLIALDGHRHWYRYHHLFADLLRHKLIRSQGRSVRDLHRRAAAWYADHNMTADALHHALALKDFKQAAELIDPRTSVMIGQGETHTLQHWIEALPETTLRQYPNLTVSLAWLYNLNNQGQPFEPLLQMALQTLAASDFDAQTEAFIRGNVAMLRAYAALGQNQPGEAISFLAEALAILPEEDDYLRSIAAFTQGVIFKRGGIWEPAEAALQDGYDRGVAAGNLTLAMGSIIHLIEMWIVQGRLCQASRLCHQVIQQHHAAPVANLGFAHTKLAEIQYEWNELESAAANLEQGFAYLEAMFAAIGWERDAALCLLRMKQCQGDPGAALAAWQRAVAISEQMQDQHDRIDLTFWQVRLWLRQGNLTAATRWQRETLHKQAEDRPEWVDVTLAQVFIAQGQGKLALDLLDAHRESAAAAGRYTALIELLALSAVACQLDDDTARARAWLREALVLAEPEGFVRVFVETGPVMAELLRLVKRPVERTRAGDPNLFSSGYVDRLLAAFPAAAPIDVSLNEREIEILHLLAAGLKTPEIAAELYLSKNTVKWYLKGIYEKLNVHNRADALDSGIRRGLLT